MKLHVWIGPKVSRSSVWIGEQEGRVYVYSKCCGGELKKNEELDRFACTLCNKVLKVQPDERNYALDWIVSEHCWQDGVIKEWTSTWTGIPPDAMTVTVDGDILD